MLYGFLAFAIYTAFAEPLFGRYHIPQPFPRSEQENRSVAVSYGISVACCGSILEWQAPFSSGAVITSDDGIFSAL
ncbi:hypothetical protein [Sphingobium fuliginis]|uniref:hypothetical protein n=1 Tax=Sphingobium fuliginis (strain ATCC 27551) TaxID=336203 RepID=UPI001C3FBCEC|nr:hypothetical protein [Sphingobium fuliginis]